jgi:ABC-2 type transport system ATP-binding protein
MLEVKQVHVAFKNQLILKNASFTVEDSTIACLVAPNGRGKTALLNVICGLLPSKTGGIKCNGISLRSKRRAFLHQLFYVQSTEDLFGNLTVKDHLRYVKKMWQSTIDITKVLTRVELTNSQNKQIQQLSLDKKQQVLLAMAIVSDAPVLLMDEPLNGLDVEATRKFEEIFVELRGQGKTIVFASHQLDSIERVSDKLLFLKDQQILTVENMGQDVEMQYGEMYLT